MAGPARSDREPLDTAHQVWDRWWTQASELAAWSDPEPSVLARIDDLRQRNARRVLDLGAGIGRHAAAFARAGFGVVAIDASETGLDHLTRLAASECLDVRCVRALFTGLPLADRTVDHVLAWNVLYHGDTEVLNSALRECRRVLISHGTIQVTMLSKRHRLFGVGHEIRPDTFVDPASEGDKAHPHLYVDAASLVRVLDEAGFTVISMVDVDQAPPGEWHWNVTAQATPLTRR